MHYGVVVITKEFPTNDVLSKVLEPYDESAFWEKYEDKELEEISAEEYPVIQWDWWQVGGRYGGNLKLKIDYEDDEYKWMFCAKEPRVGRLFRSMMCERLDASHKNDMFFTPAEDEYREYIGARDGYIRVDGCKVKDVIDFEETVIEHSFGFIGKDGEAYAKESWNGHDFVKDEHYTEKVKEAIKDVQDCYVTYVDCHD